MEPIRRGASALALLVALVPDASRSAEPFTATGVVRAAERIELRTDLLAAVREVRRREGEHFAAGDVLITFDCARQRADHEALRARARAATAEARQTGHLHSLGAAGSGELRVARARAEAAEAEARSLDARLEGCAIAAPFAGRVGRIRAEAHAVPERGAPLMELIGSAPPEIDMRVPSEWLRWLRVDAPLRFELRETGTVLDARVARLGAEVDPASRTIAVRAVPEAPDSSVLPGMSGVATFGGTE